MHRCFSATHPHRNSSAPAKIGFHAAVAVSGYGALRSVSPSARSISAIRPRSHCRGRNCRGTPGCWCCRDDERRRVPEYDLSQLSWPGLSSQVGCCRLVTFPNAELGQARVRMPSTSYFSAKTWMPGIRFTLGPAEGRTRVPGMTIKKSALRRRDWRRRVRFPG